jgi:hypothetical protein
MAGVLGQTNATVTEITKAAPLGDSFLSDSFGSGETNGGGHGKGHGHGHGPHTEVLWEGRAGIWIAPIQETKESSTDGRDEIAQRVLHMPKLCQLSIGDCLKIETWEGDEVIWQVAGLTLLGEGIELGAAQLYQVQIEVF